MSNYHYTFGGSNVPPPPSNIMNADSMDLNKTNGTMRSYTPDKGKVSDSTEGYYYSDKRSLLDTCLDMQWRNLKSIGYDHDIALWIIKTKLGLEGEGHTVKLRVVPHTSLQDSSRILLRYLDSQTLYLLVSVEIAKEIETHLLAKIEEMKGHLKNAIILVSEVHIEEEDGKELKDVFI